MNYLKSFIWSRETKTTEVDGTLVPEERKQMGKVEQEVIREADTAAFSMVEEVASPLISTIVAKEEKEIPVIPDESEEMLRFSELVRLVEESFKDSPEKEDFMVIIRACLVAIFRSTTSSLHMRQAMFFEILTFHLEVLEETTRLQLAVKEAFLKSTLARERPNDARVKSLAKRLYIDREEKEALRARFELEKQRYQMEKEAAEQRKRAEQEKIAQKEHFDIRILRFEPANDDKIVEKTRLNHKFMISEYKEEVERNGLNVLAECDLGEYCEKKRYLVEKIKRLLRLNEEVKSRASKIIVAGCILDVLINNCRFLQQHKRFAETVERKLHEFTFKEFFDCSEYYKKAFGEARFNEWVETNSAEHENLKKHKLMVWQTEVLKDKFDDFSYRSRQQQMLLCALSKQFATKNLKNRAECTIDFSDAEQESEFCGRLSRTFDRANATNIEQKQRILEFAFDVLAQNKDILARNKELCECFEKKRTECHIRP